MRYLLAVFAVLFAASAFAATTPAPAFQADIAYGKLTVYSDVNGSDIYIDAKFVGQDRAMISNIPVGKHYVRVVKDEATIQSGIVDVKEGEETIIVAKPAEEELLSRFKKQNQMQLYASYSMLNYIGRKSGTTEISADLSPMYGLNFEGIFPVSDINLTLGFRYNLSSPLSSNGTKITDITISGPYANLSKRIMDKVLGNRNLSLDIGGGANYSFYAGEMISIIGTWGYQFYAELTMKGENQFNVFRFGYVNYNGRGSNQYNFSNAGYFLTGGIMYKL